jgi:hypothetical protein
MVMEAGEDLGTIPFFQHADIQIFIKPSKGDGLAPGGKFHACKKELGHCKFLS